MIPLIERSLSDSDRSARTAIVADGDRYSYSKLLQASARIATALLEGTRDLNEARVAFLVPPSFDYVSIQWGIWRAGGVAVPLCPDHPEPELEYSISDSQAAIVVAHPVYASSLEPIAAKRKLRFLRTNDFCDAANVALPEVESSRRALMLYTSGTTGKPKGVVSTHEIIAAQIQSLVQAWEWSENDHILNVLPLHHIHGVINVLGCALWSGATWETLPKFDADAVWTRIGDGDLTLFMAVPTVYARLIAAYEKASPDMQERMRGGCPKLRLMVSGSAALPVATLEKWREISGHTLLERYGMSEIGMAISNPLHGERRPGCIGVPLPDVQVRVVDEGNTITQESTPGEIQIKGPNVFREYWQREAATAEAFTKDGWFKTGDVVVRENGYYRILGRDSIDIIKTGGYKVSALEIEEILLKHAAISECAVVGVPDDEWGQRVAAVVVLAPGETLDLSTLRSWCKERLARYKIPTWLHVARALPRNAMGKVTKPALVEWCTPKPSTSHTRILSL